MPVDEADAEMAHDALRPSRTVLLCGSVAIALISGATLPWPHAIASTVLGVLMTAGMDLDTRSYLLPNAVTGGALLAGLAATAALDPFDRWLAFATAAENALLVGGILWLIRWIYHLWRGREGLGLGDVKLAAAIGAWLPLDNVAACFTLATGAALIMVLQARLRGQSVERTARVPFGAFLCPALWLVDYTTRLLGS